MDATLALIDSDAELARARTLVGRLSNSEDPADIARLQAQARLIAAYKESKRPRRPPSTAELVRPLIDQHGLTRADRSPSWECRAALSKSYGKKALSMAMVQRLRARFHVPVGFLIPPPKVTGRAPKPARPMADLRTAIRGQRRMTIGGMIAGSETLAQPRAPRHIPLLFGASVVMTNACAAFGLLPL